MVVDVKSDAYGPAVNARWIHAHRCSSGSKNRISLRRLCAATVGRDAVEPLPGEHFVAKLDGRRLGLLGTRT